MRKIELIHEFSYAFSVDVGNEPGWGWVVRVHPDSNPHNNGLNEVFIQEMGSWRDTEQGRRDALAHFAFTIGLYRERDARRNRRSNTAPTSFNPDFRIRF